MSIARRRSLRASLFVLLLCGGALLAACSSDESQPPPSQPASDDTLLEEGLVAPPPPMSVVPERPLSGQTVKVRVVADGSTSIALTVAGSGCGTVAAKTGPSPLEVTGTAAANGYCDVAATASFAGGPSRTLEGRFEIQASAPDLPPVTPTDGVFVMQPYPAATTSGAGLSITAADGAPSFINGSSGSYVLSYAGSTDVRAALVKVPGYDGYFRVPVTAEAGKVSLELNFAADFFQRTGALQRSALHLAVATGPLTLQVALEDVLGVVGPAFTLSLTPKEVKTGEVKVSIAWDSPTDVDLHVTEPGGEHIYYSHKTSATGGQLDLDSNAGCSIDGVNNENIVWPIGKSPNGDFQVRVHMYQSPCGTGPASASGTLTISYCGPDSPKVIPFTLPADEAEYRTTFTSRCTTRVKGTVRYEDFPVTLAGFGPGGLVPARFVEVKVLRARDNAELGKGSTDAAGRYDVAFSNDGDPGFYVQVSPRRDSAGLKQEVKDLAGQLYAFRRPQSTEPPLDVRQPPADGNGFQVDFDVLKAEGAGALNIFDVGLTCALHAFGSSGKAPVQLTFRWTAGQRPPAGNTSYYDNGSPGQIWVNGDAQLAREYNDVVIGHEYGHFLLANWGGVNPLPGGSHTPYERSAPALAWSEGWATYFAAASQGQSAYIAINSTGVGFAHSIETLPAEIPAGNLGGTLDGNVSEAVVAAVLYDLFDTTDETSDTLSGKSGAIWSVVGTYLKPGYAKFANRGVAGPDLVDFLDGWACLGYGDRGDDDAHGLRGVVKGLASLSYDFPALPSCK